MGYTHYWERTANFEQQPFQRVVADCKKLLPLLEQVGIPLAGCDGKGVPEFTAEQIAFNGVAGCGHEQRNLGITWPSRGAHGVAGAVQRGPPVTVAETLRAALTGKSEALALRDSDVSDQWLAGCTVCTRTCDGDCSHESFVLPRIYLVEGWQKLRNGCCFNFCKTAYKPYDLAVNLALIVAKHHLGQALLVDSDGSSEQWEEAMLICQHVLGFGKDFRLAEWQKTRRGGV